MSKSEWILNLVGLLILFLIVSGIFLFLELKKEATICYADPVKCAAERVAEQNNQDVTIMISSFGKESIMYSTDLYSAK